MASDTSGQPSRAIESEGASRRGSGRSTAIRRTEEVRVFGGTRFFACRDNPNVVMIDLEFDTLGEAEGFLRTMQQIWGGPGRAIMQNPSGRIADIVEVKEL